MGHLIETILPVEALLSNIVEFELFNSQKKLQFIIIYKFY